jgi:hypothetical protein
MSDRDTTQDARSTVYENIDPKLLTQPQASHHTTEAAYTSYRQHSAQVWEEYAETQIFIPHQHERIQDIDSTVRQYTARTQRF